MDIIIYLICVWAILAYIIFAVWPWLCYQFDLSKKIKLMAIKDYLYEKIDFCNSYDIGSTFSRGDFTVNYQICTNNGFKGEKLVICSLPLKGKSHEMVIEYLNGEVVIVKINNKTINTSLSPDNYLAAHKILELGQQAYKGCAIP